eukprot:TRINITY_DN13564_c0_g1_i2.p1 TRINITY_DN13564_c0_g1~~TRINITY_DN13564_c0_g1_i2.p1  ORF type:complete len:875 (+),score=190.30 TRINITY_DN13564_c0_g1_i2:175-2799(+)
MLEHSVPQLLALHAQAPTEDHVDDLALDEDSEEEAADDANWKSPNSSTSTTNSYFGDPDTDDTISVGTPSVGDVTPRTSQPQPRHIRTLFSRTDRTKKGGQSESQHGEAEGGEGSVRGGQQSLSGGKKSHSGKLTGWKPGFMSKSASKKGGVHDDSNLPPSHGTESHEFGSGGNGKSMLERTVSAGDSSRSAEARSPTEETAEWVRDSSSGKNLPPIRVTRDSDIKQSFAQRPKKEKEKKEKSSLNVKKTPTKEDLERYFPQLQKKSSSNGLASKGDSSSQSDNAAKRTVPRRVPSVAEIEKREPRVARPPPKPSAAPSDNPSPSSNLGLTIPGGAPPTPPPPPPPRKGLLPGAEGGAPAPPPMPPPKKGKGKAAEGGGMKRAPEVISFYQLLMKKENEALLQGVETGGGGAVGIGGGDGKGITGVRSDMIDEIENRSIHVLQVKHDVEVQKDFVNSLCTAVRSASYNNMDDIVEFIKWLDEELAFLVDERAVLKHFDWPEAKSDTLREAAFQYLALQKLLEEVRECGKDDGGDEPRHQLENALKRLQRMLEKAEQMVLAAQRTRDGALKKYAEHKIPTYWLRDSGIIAKIKAESVNLARAYMRRVTAELDAVSGKEDMETLAEFLLLQGVRFAFRVHQFAGGFDNASMSAFEELRSRAGKVGQPGGPTEQKGEGAVTAATAAVPTNTPASEIKSEDPQTHSHSEEATTSAFESRPAEEAATTPSATLVPDSISAPDTRTNPASTEAPGGGRAHATSTETESEIETATATAAATEFDETAPKVHAHVDNLDQSIIVEPSLEQDGSQESVQEALSNELNDEQSRAGVTPALSEGIEAKGTSESEAHFKQGKDRETRLPIGGVLYVGPRSPPQNKS